MAIKFREFKDFICNVKFSYLNLIFFKELKDTDLFKNFNLKNNTITWCNGEIDFAPDTIYEQGVIVK